MVANVFFYTDLSLVVATHYERCDVGLILDTALDPEMLKNTVIKAALEQLSQ